MKHFEDICITIQLHRREDQHAVEQAILQIVARVIDLRRHLSQEDFDKLPCLPKLFDAIRSLTNELGWADDVGDFEAQQVCCSWEVH